MYDPVAIVSDPTNKKQDIVAFLIAHLDIGEFDKATELLQYTFEGTKKELLKGMIQEYQGNYSDAVKIYDSVIGLDPSHMDCRKRKIVCLVEQGQLQKGIEEMCLYVDIFGQDIDAWGLLSKWYLQLSMYQQALFCMEELMMLSPGISTLLEFADHSAPFRPTLAIQYYLKSINIQPTLRAWYGILILIRQHQVTNPNDDQWKELHLISKQQISNFYKESSLQKIVGMWLQ
jgi:tetratricopeptide (TPR) repeat protein